jgi:hypothetical protein
MKKIFFVVLSLGFVFNSFSQGSEKSVTYLDCFYSFLRGTNAELTDDLVTRYIRDYHNNIYRQHHNNEFEWHGKIEEYRKELSQKISAQSLDIAYAIVTNVEFNNYDFDKDGFPVNISEGTFFPLDSKERTYLNRIGLYLIDLSNYNFFAMERNDANMFIKNRTSNSGRVDRQVRLLIYFKLADFASADYLNISTLMDKNRYYPLAGIISRIEVYDDTKKIGGLIK